MTDAHHLVEELLDLLRRADDLGLPETARRIAVASGVALAESNRAAPRPPLAADAPSATSGNVVYLAGRAGPGASRAARSVAGPKGS